MRRDWPRPTLPTSSEAMPNGRTIMPTTWSNLPMRYRDMKGPSGGRARRLLDLRRVDRDRAHVGGLAGLDGDGRAPSLLRVDVADLLLPEHQVLLAGGDALDLERAVLARDREEGMVE